MEADQHEVHTGEEKYVELYSKRAIRGFSIFFSPIFGGVLLMLNLRRAGFVKEGYTVLGFSILYLVFTAIVLSSINQTGNSLTILFNLGGGLILTEYFFKKYFPDDDYFPRSIWKALIVSLLITIPFVIAFLYFGGPEAAGIK